MTGYAAPYLGRKLNFQYGEVTLSEREHSDHTVESAGQDETFDQVPLKDADLP
jgi:hypothetical protein